MTEFLLAYPTRYVIARSKIVDYLLNPNHTRGGSKAKFFMSFGFSADRPEMLADALAAQRSIPREEGTPNLAPGGSKIVIEGPISAPDGKGCWQQPAEPFFRQCHFQCALNRFRLGPA